MDEHECEVHYSPRDRRAPITHEAGPTWRGDARAWHRNAIADAGTSHTLVGRQYVVACEWCRCAFVAPTKDEAIDMFREHEEEMSRG